MESLWALFTEGEFTCALAPLNPSLLVALLVLVLVCKKAFCGWACPVGLLEELAARLGGAVWKRRPSVPPKLNARLKLLRYAALAAALFFTYRTGELVLRSYDPYYLIFSGFGLRGRFDRPTPTKTFVDKPGAKATFIVDGVRCRGMAGLLAALSEDVPGIHAIMAFASEHKAVFTFDGRGITHIDGKPFFPVGIYLYDFNSDILAEVHQQGFNTIIWGASESRWGVS